MKNNRTVGNWKFFQRPVQNPKTSHLSSVCLQEVVCNSRPVVVFSHGTALSPDPCETTVQLTEGRCPPLRCQDDGGPRQAGGESRPEAFSMPFKPEPKVTALGSSPGRTAEDVSQGDHAEKESGYGQCSPCWSEERPPPPQLYRAQTCLRPPAERPLPLNNSLSHSPLHHASSNGVLRSRQRRAVRLKVTANKSTITM